MSLDNRKRLKKLEKISPHFDNTTTHLKDSRFIFNENTLGYMKLSVSKLSLFYVHSKTQCLL